MLYDLSLHMGYTYDIPASGARHILRVAAAVAARTASG